MGKTVRVRRALNGLNLLLTAGILLISANDPIAGPVPEYACKVIASFPHDQEAFTQGLIFHNGNLYEGTGLRGKSSIRRVDLSSGRVLKSRSLPPSLFGEGIAIVGDRIIQLTWRAGLAFEYDPVDFVITRTFSYKAEGWGLTYDGNRLIMSDGSSRLYFLDPSSFRVIETLSVKENGRPVRRINELEYIKGYIYANIWKTSRIAVIDPSSGKVEAWLDLSDVVERAGGDNSSRTLNGIAYDAKRDRIYVTGKLWPRIYEIEILPPR